MLYRWTVSNACTDPVWDVKRGMACRRGCTTLTGSAGGFGRWIFRRTAPLSWMVALVLLVIPQQRGGAENDGGRRRPKDPGREAFHRVHLIRLIPRLGRKEALASLNDRAQWCSLFVATSCQLVSYRSSSQAGSLWLRCSRIAHGH